MFFRLSYMPDHYLLLIGMYCPTCYTYLILVFELSACVSSFFAHTRFQFLNYPHVFPAFLHIPNSSFWIIRMCFQLFCTYQIPVFELSACISWFFAHTRFLFLTSAHVFSNARLNNWDVFHNPAEKDCSPGRRCGGDCEIFLESGWPLSFRKSTVVASIRVRDGQPFLRGFYGPLRYKHAPNS